MCLERLCNFFCHRHQCEDHQLVVQANWGLCDSARRVLQHAGVRAVERGRDRDNSGIGGSVSSKAGSGGGSDRANKDRGGRDRVGMVRVSVTSQSLVCLTWLEFLCHKITQMTVE